MFRRLFSGFRSVLLIGGLAVGSCVSFAEETRWSDREAAERAATLVGPRTAAVVHFRATPCAEATYAASWLDRFEKRLANEALEGIGMREAVAAIDVDSSGSLTLRATLAMKEGYLAGPISEDEMRSFFQPLAEHVEFGERTIRLSSHPFDAPRREATIDVAGLERNLELVEGSPLRLVTVDPRPPASEAVLFVSSPQRSADAAPRNRDSFAIGFDPGVTSASLHLARNGRSTFELAIDEENEFAPIVRATACLARSASDAVSRSFAGKNVEIDDPAENTVGIAPFGLPVARR